MGRKGLLELLVATLIVFACSVVPAACQTAYIVPSQRAEFNPDNHTYNDLAYAAADPGYDVVLLVGDFRVEPALWPESHPVRRSRNLTISSFNYAEKSYALLELEFLEARFLIAANTTVQLRDIALGRTRKSSGQQLPFFAGEGQQSVLQLLNVARLRTACAHDSHDLAAALAEGFRSGPGEAGQGANDVYVKTFKWHGQLYPDSLHADDVSTFVNPGDVTETRSIDAGYTLLQKNTTRVCLAYVDPTCVAQRGADACVVALVDQILASDSSAGGRQSVAKIVAPIVVAGVLLPAAVIAFLLYRRNRRRRAQQALLPDTEKGVDGQQLQLLASGKDGRGSGSEGALSNKSKQNKKESDVGPSEDQDTDTLMPGRPHGGASGSLEALAVGGAQGGWQLLACHTSPEFKDATPNDSIKLGVLLGAGSFGRVYKGRWHSMDVAVKVLQHDSTTAAAISNEVDLVMSFRHPNIVAAYHFVTWTQQPTDDSLAATEGRGRWRLRPVVESAYDDGNYDNSMTYRQSPSSFPRPPAVVIAGRDGSTMSASIALTARTRSTNDPTAKSTGNGTLVGTMDTTQSSNPGSSSSNVQAMMAVLSNSQERNAIGGTDSNVSNDAGLAGVSRAPLPSGSAAALNPTPAASQVALNPNPRPGPGHLGQGLVIPVTTEGSGGSGLGLNSSLVIPSPVSGATTLKRFNSHGSIASSTSSSTAAVAAVLAAGRQGGRGSPAIAARSAGAGSPLRAKSPVAAAAAAAGGRVQAGGAQQYDAAQQQQQHPTSVMVPASIPQQQQQQQHPAWPPLLQHYDPQQQQQQQSSGVSIISNDIVDIQTPAQLYGLGPHGVNLQLPASALRQPRSSAAAPVPQPAHTGMSAHANSSGSSGGQQQQQQRGPADQQISGLETFVNPLVKPSFSKIGLDGNVVAGTHPVIDEDSAVMRFVPFTQGQLVEYEQRSDTAGSSCKSPSAVPSPTGTAAAAATGSAVQPSTRSPSATAAAAVGSKPSQSSGTVSGTTTPEQIQQQQQQPASGSDQTPSQTTTPDQIQQQQQQSASGSDQTPSHTPQWHSLGDYSHKSPSGAATAAAAAPAAHLVDPADASPVVPQPANFDGGDYAGICNVSNSSLSSVGRPVGRGAAARQLSEAQTWLILEYCNGGTLLDLIQDEQMTGHQVPSPKSRRKHAFMLTLLSDVATGMLYLHRRNVLHGDLKPGNILIRYESGLPYGRAAKVSDFGLSRALNVGQSHRSTRTMGTMNHTPPELLRLGRLSPAGDVYAFGIIMWEVYTGEVAFHGLHYGELFEQVALWQKRPPVPDDMPKDYAELMTECWAADSFRRPTFDVIQTSLKEMLDRVLQDEKEAQDRFVSDL